MRLVIDLRLINSSGIGVYLKNIIPLILHSFNEVFVLGDKDEILKFSWATKVKIIQFTSKTYFFYEQIKYPFIIPKCDVFWCPHFNAPLLPIRANKILVTIHDCNHIANPDYFSFFTRIWAKILYKNATWKSDSILTVSNFSKREIIKYLKVSEEKIRVIYLGVNSDFASNINSGNYLKLPSKYFLFVGNVKPHKNLITLLRAYSMLDNNVKREYKLVILGKKQGFITGDNSVFKFIEDNNLDEFVYFTGYIPDDDVPSVYKNASLFIFPSLYEGFGLPILEAMSCKVPVLTSNQASLPEVGGEAVIYFNPFDAKELFGKINQILNDSDLRQKMNLEATKQIKKFTWEKTAEEHLKVFKLLIEAH